MSEQCSVDQKTCAGHRAKARKSLTITSVVPVYANVTCDGEERNNKAKGDSDRDRGGRETGQKIKVHSLRKNKGKNITEQRLRTTITFGRHALLVFYFPISNATLAPSALKDLNISGPDIRGPKPLCFPGPKYKYLYPVVFPSNLSRGVYLSAGLWFLFYFYYLCAWKPIRRGKDES